MAMETPVFQPTCQAGAKGGSAPTEFSVQDRLGAEWQLSPGALLGQPTSCLLGEQGRRAEGAVSALGPFPRQEGFCRKRASLFAFLAPTSPSPPQNSASKHSLNQ